MRLTSSLVFLLGLPALAWAQAPGNYEPFGLGCAGTGFGPLVVEAANPSGGTLQELARGGEFAYGVQARGNAAVVGFELFTRAVGTERTIGASLYLEMNGSPSVQAAATGMLVAGTQPGFYRVLFDQPVPVATGQRFWISQHEATAVLPADLRQGATAAEPGYYRSGSGAWQLWPFTDRPSFRVLAVGQGAPGAVPHLWHSGLPAVGKSFGVGIDYLPQNAHCILVIGGSRTGWAGLRLPFDLTPAGAPGCSLLAAFDVPLFISPSSTRISIPIAIPNAPALRGVRFYNQWFVVDPRANALGLSSTGGAAATIGG